jgi:mRNA-degrading endonuclease toxin of MazEF toxin-antitoxin module
LAPISSLRYGRIVYAWIPDRHGYKKLRPAVVLTSNEEIPAVEEFAVVAVTTTFTDPPPQFCAPLPWHPRGHPVTKLTKRSAAVCNWVAALKEDEIVGFGGDVPAKTMRLIEDRMP